MGIFRSGIIRSANTNYYTIEKNIRPTQEYIFRVRRILDIGEAGVTVSCFTATTGLLI